MAAMCGRIKAISISTRKGIPKVNVSEAQLLQDHGIEGDAHAGKWHRQVSLLDIKAIESAKKEGVSISPGEFAENLTVEGLDLASLRMGSRLRVGENAELEVTQRGKKCHGHCVIFEKLGDCIMPREGLFTRVIRSGYIKTGDIVEVINDESCDTDG